MRVEAVASQRRNTRRPRPPRMWLGVVALVVAMIAGAADNGVARVASLVDTGRFAEAEEAITQALAARSIDAGARDALQFERERMRRINLDFTLSEEQVRARLRELLPDLREEEFAAWDRANLLEHLTIDGGKRYFSRAVSNLFRIDPAAAARRKAQAPFRDSPLQQLHPHHRAVREAALAGGKTSVLPQHIRVTQSLTVEPDAVPAGEVVRAWIPYPRAIAGQQESIRFIDSRPSGARIAPESTLQRTAYLEQKAEAGKATKFEISYDLVISAQDHAIHPEKVVAARMTPELAPFVAERAPHVVFTDDMRRFSREVVGDEKNPYRIAQKLFAAVDERFPWAGAREYSTLRNISDYTLHARHGDCGEQTLLLITLLRLNGIPARWQSGMMFSPTDYWNLHDWGQVYLAPYGWVPMDVTFGRFAGDPALEWFYLGGLDGYRIAFNDDWGAPLWPAKQHFRSETVDSQRGEVEWSGGNLYFDQWNYDFAWQVLPEPNATR
jgi:transglutaminase-like putative cysteine protease